MCAQIVDSGFFGWRGENFHELQIRATTLAVMVDDICRRNIRLPTYVYVYFRWLAAGTLSFWQRSRERELRIKYAFQRRMRFFNWDCCVCVRYAHLAANLCMSATTRQQRNADQKKKKNIIIIQPTDAISVRRQMMGPRTLCGAMCCVMTAVHSSKCHSFLANARAFLIP